MLSSSLFSDLKAWDKEGKYITWGARISALGSQTIWKGNLACGGSTNITVWSDFNVRTLCIEAHTDWVIALLPVGDFLFSASNNGAFKKWNERGECVMQCQRQLQIIRTMLEHDNMIYCGLTSGRVATLGLDGKWIQDFCGHNEQVEDLVIWRGALFSGSENLIQWTPFYIWNPSRHKFFPQSIKQAIKIMMILVHSRHFPYQALLPVDILFVVFQFFASDNIEWEFESSKKQNT